MVVFSKMRSRISSHSTSLGGVIKLLRRSGDPEFPVGGPIFTQHVSILNAKARSSKTNAKIHNTLSTLYIAYLMVNLSPLKRMPIHIIQHVNVLNAKARYTKTNANT